MIKDAKFSGYCFYMNTNRSALVHLYSLLVFKNRWSWNWEKLIIFYKELLILYLKKQDSSTSSSETAEKYISLLLFHFLFPWEYVFQYFFDLVRSQTSKKKKKPFTRANRSLSLNKMKRSWKESFTWACLKF